MAVFEQEPEMEKRSIGLATLIGIFILSSATAAYADPTPDDKVYLPIVLNQQRTYFTTLPPGSALPGDAYCAAHVKPAVENKGDNLAANATLGGQGLAPDFFTPNSGDPRANTQIAARVDGAFTGTTDEILQWAACKWGINEDIVRAQAVIESGWRQSAKGDFRSDASTCAPGHGLGQDGREGLCPNSWGILQNSYTYEKSAWPAVYQSTAFNADTAYAIWRACYEGYQWWFNDVEHGSTYQAGDAWGCVGAWYAGRWHTSAADGYITQVKADVGQRVWEEPNFQEP
jgi:autotransporter family porin